MKHPLTPKENIRIAPYTSMRVGGEVRYLYRPETEAQLAEVIRFCKGEGLPYLVIGNASNLLFPDEGFDGAVIATTGIKEIRLEEGRIVASCGASLSALSVFAMEQGLKGLAFAFGIPGTVGGGVYMNAGAYGGEISDCLESVRCLNGAGEEIVLTKEELGLSYRHSRLQEEELLLLSAAFRCEEGDPKEIKGEMDKNMNARKEKQPLEYPSCGSAFKRPAGYYAGALIQEAGLKGYSMGGAQVSEKHAGFVINKGNATADDVKALLAYVQKTVYDQSGVLLEPEIKIL
ncbi:MAG: UDP-N-acetylmuramate dehydrogenase [Ruminococcaceae bacterium]|nr:UDP-N-acetylmuramate dehydrogenase [Oscillospiraceae bacterium]